MRLVLMFFLAIMLSVGLVSATGYYIEIKEGFGSNSGDKPLFQSHQIINQLNFTIKIEQGLEFKDKIKLGFQKEINEDLTVVNDTNQTDTSEIVKGPIDWGPIILWGSIIGILIGLIFAGIYIYQIYFY